MNMVSPVHTQWCVHKDGIVQFSRGLGYVDSLHLFKAAQWVTLGHQLRDCPLVQSARNEQDDVINHIAVPEVKWRKTNHKKTYMCERRSIKEKNVLFI